MLQKWQRQTGGVVDLSNVDRQRRLMALVPVEDVWGVGRRISKKLNAMGIKTALDLSEQSTWIIRKHFNVVLERTVRELRGEPCGSGGVRPGKAGNCMQPIVWRTYY